MSGRWLTADERLVARFIAAMGRAEVDARKAEIGRAVLAAAPSRMERVRAVAERYARLLAAREAAA